MKYVRSLINGSIIGGGFGAQIGAFIANFIGDNTLLITFGLVSGIILGSGIALSLVLPPSKDLTKEAGTAIRLIRRPQLVSSTGERE